MDIKEFDYEATDYFGGDPNEDEKGSKGSSIHKAVEEKDE